MQISFDKIIEILSVEIIMFLVSVELNHVCFEFATKRNFTKWLYFSEGYFIISGFLGIIWAEYFLYAKFVHATVATWPSLCIAPWNEFTA